MKRLSWKVRIGTSVPVVLGALLALPLGCGAFGTDGFLELERCDILNCDGLFFSPLDDEAADDHDDMDGMDHEDADDDGDDDHLDGVDDHGDDGDDDHMDDMEGHDNGDHMDEHEDDHDDAEEHDDATERDSGTGPGVARRV